MYIIKGLTIIYSWRTLSKLFAANVLKIKANDIPVMTLRLFFFLNIGICLYRLQSMFKTAIKKNGIAPVYKDPIILLVCYCSKLRYAQRVCIIYHLFTFCTLHVFSSCFTLKYYGIMYFHKYS